MGLILVAEGLLIAVPLWLLGPQYGKAFVLGLPPMLISAASWLVGAWWAWNKSRTVFIALTLGVTPFRLVLCLAWAWWALSLPEIPGFAFVLGLMWHWLIFTLLEYRAVYAMSQLPAAKQSKTGQATPASDGRGK